MATGFPGGASQESFPREPDRRCQTSYGLILEVLEHHFCHIQLAKQAQARPRIKARGIGVYLLVGSWGRGRQVHAAEEHITGRPCNSHRWKIQSLTPTNVFFPGEETCAKWGGKRTLSQESDRFGPYLQPAYLRASQLSHWQVSRSVPTGFEYLCLF